MNVPNEVILDLIPLYLAGEVSPATQAWIEQALAGDPSLAAEVERQRTAQFAIPAPPTPPADLEWRAIQRTRRQVSAQRWLFAAAMSLTGSGLAVVIDLAHFKAHFLMADYPAQMIGCLISGSICWALYFRQRRRVRAAR
jgi:hypothetical protein